ncbi:MAG TPA: hypothetical protein VFS43_01620 [Polyangiaceae bacterium]|nr:hypothetical protein [Polyangiaceae bacterium]
MHHAFACSLGAALLSFAGAAFAQAPGDRPSPPPPAPPGATPPARPGVAPPARPAPADAASPARPGPADATSPARPVPADATSPARATPADAASPGRPAPADAASPARPAPGAAPSARPAPADAAPPAAAAAPARPGTPTRGAQGPSPDDAPAPPPQAQTPRPRAYGSSSDDEVNFAVPATRRGGFLVGVVLGGQVTGAEGTPTDYDERGDAFRVSTGTTLGTTRAFFLGGALNDWFAFKLGFQQGSASKGGYELATSGVLIGVEAWPLFSLGGSFRDVGLLVDFGTGGATVERDGEELANAGAYSLVRAGLVWDALRLWKINLGPTLAFEHTTSETYRQNALWFGLRSVFYGAP